MSPGISPGVYRVDTKVAVGTMVGVAVCLAPSFLQSGTVHLGNHSNAPARFYLCRGGQSSSEWFFAGTANLKTPLLKSLLLAKNLASSFLRVESPSAPGSTRGGVGNIIPPSQGYLVWVGGSLRV